MLPTIEEFRAAARRFHLLACCLAVLHFCAFVAVAFTTEKFTPILEARFGKEAAQFAMQALVFSLVFYMPGGIWLIQQQYKWFRSLCCPNCRKSLCGPRRHKLVIASQHCPHCGEQAVRLADDMVNPSLKPIPVPPTFEAYVSDHEQCLQLFNKSIVRWKVILFGFILLGVIAGRLSEPWLGPVMSKVLPAIVFTTCLPFLLLFYWKGRRWYKRFPALQCQHCGKSLYGTSRIVKATRQCTHCGRPVIKEPADAAVD